MNDKDKLRIGDSDRELVSRLVKSAVDEGRLSLAEYDERLQQIFDAKTVGDLQPITDDLMGTGRNVVEVPVHKTQVPAKDKTPAWVKWMWFGWSVPTLLCTVIYLLAFVTTGDLVTFWPMWVGGVIGAPMLSVTFMERFMIRPARRNRRKNGS